MVNDLVEFVHQTALMASLTWEPVWIHACFCAFPRGIVKFDRFERS